MYENKQIILTRHAIDRAKERTTIPNATYLRKALTLALKKNQQTDLEEKYLEDVPKAGTEAYLLGNSIFIIKQKGDKIILLTVLKKPINLYNRFYKGGRF